jgi:hypothetical protein
MKIKIDECLPRDITGLLTVKGHQAETVTDEGLTGSPDDIIWETVQTEKSFLITSDIDNTVNINTISRISSSFLYSKFILLSCSYFLPVPALRFTRFRKTIRASKPSFVKN